LTPARFRDATGEAGFYDCDCHHFAALT
jgi:hypothetical protein